MATKKKKIAKTKKETDSAYFLKIVLYLILSTVWVRISVDSGAEYPLPVGALIALIYASHDHFQLDRKIEYALILVSMFISFWLPIGLYISL